MAAAVIVVFSLYVLFGFGFSFSCAHFDEHAQVIVYASSPFHVVGMIGSCVGLHWL